MEKASTLTQASSNQLFGKGKEAEVSQQIRCPELVRALGGSGLSSLKHLALAKVILHPSRVGRLSRLPPEILTPLFADPQILSHLANEGLLEGVAKALVSLPAAHKLDLRLVDLGKVPFELLGSKLVNLREIDLTGNECNAVLGRMARSFSSLQTLCLKRCSDVTDEGIKALAPLSSSLRVLDLTDHHPFLPDIQTRRLTYRSLKVIEQHFTGLVSLNLTHCKYLPAANLARIATACTKLQSLHLGVTDVNEKVLGAIASHLGKLQVLDLTGWRALGRTTLITDQGLLDVAKGCPKLRTLTLELCLLLTPTGFQAAAPHLTGLTHLNLSGVASNKWVEAIATHCTQLASLNLSRTTVTDEGIWWIVAMCTSLDTLDLTWCGKVTTEGLKVIQSTHPRLKISSSEPV